MTGYFNIIVYTNFLKLPYFLLKIFFSNLNKVWNLVSRQKSFFLKFWSTIIHLYHHYTKLISSVENPICNLLFLSTCIYSVFIVLVLFVNCNNSPLVVIQQFESDYKPVLPGGPHAGQWSLCSSSAHVQPQAHALLILLVS